MMRLFNKNLAVFLFGFSLSAAAANNPFLAISDLHFNPFDPDKTHYPVADKSTNDHNDTNLVYLQKVIDKMASVSARINPQPKFIVITGDLLAHKFESKFNNRANTGGLDICGAGVTTVGECILLSVKKIVELLREVKTAVCDEHGKCEQKKIFENTPIYIALGNNDSDLGDYTVDQAFLADLGKQFAAYAKVGDFSKSFAKNGGVYSIEAIPNVSPKLNLVALDTVLYSNKLLDNDKPDLGLQLKCVVNDKTITDPCKDLRKKQNSFIATYAANNSKSSTLVLTHVPPYVGDRGYNLEAEPALLANIFNLDNAFVLAGHWHAYGALTASKYANKLKGFMLNSITYRGEEKYIPLPGFIIFDFEKAAEFKVLTHCEIKNPSRDVSQHASTVNELPFECSAN